MRCDTCRQRSRLSGLENHIVGEEVWKILHSDGRVECAKFALRLRPQGYGETGPEADSRATVAPRCVSAASQNSATRGWFSSVCWTMPR